MENIEKTCKECGKPFMAPSGLLAACIVRCQPCVEAHHAEQSEIEKVMEKLRLEKEWLGICPSSYVKTDADKIPNRAAYGKVMDWKFSPTGLILYGENRKGKTRSAWSLLGREHNAGRRCGALDTMAGADYASKFGQSTESAAHWLMELVELDVLLLDDVFKCKFTDSFENVILTLVDQRIAYERPIIVTTNDTGDSLAGRMTADRGSALVLRLRECCTAIAF